MTYDHNQLRASNLACELHAAENVIVQHVPRNPCVEDITNALIENLFGRAARIQATQHDREGILSGSGSLALGNQITVEWPALRKPLVARLEFLQCAGGSDGGLRGLGLRD